MIIVCIIICWFCAHTARSFKYNKMSYFVFLIFQHSLTSCDILFVQCHYCSTRRELFFFIVTSSCIVVVTLFHRLWSQISLQLLFDFCSRTFNLTRVLVDGGELFFVRSNTDCTICTILYLVFILFRITGNFLTILVFVLLFDQICKRDVMPLPSPVLEHSSPSLLWIITGWGNANLGIFFVIK